MWAMEMLLKAGADVPQYNVCFGVGPGKYMDGGIDVGELWSGSRERCRHRFSSHTQAGWRSFLLVTRGTGVS